MGRYSTLKVIFSATSGILFLLVVAFAQYVPIGEIKNWYEGAKLPHDNSWKFVTERMSAKNSSLIRGLKGSTISRVEKWENKSLVRLNKSPFFWYKVGKFWPLSVSSYKYNKAKRTILATLQIPLTERRLQFFECRYNLTETEIIINGMAMETGVGFDDSNQLHITGWCAEEMVIYCFVPFVSSPVVATEKTKVWFNMV